MSSGDDTSIDKTELQKRLMEIDKQMLNLADEKKAIEFKLCENTERNKDCFSNNNNNNNNNHNEKNISNDNMQSSNNNAISNSIFEEDEEGERFREIKIPAFYLDSTQNEEQTLNEEIFKNYDTLKFFFEETWDVDFLKPQILVPDNQITDREKAAYKKMCFFVNRHYINDYDEKIQKASLKEVFDLPRAQRKAAIQNLFDQIIIRSKVLELFENCGKQAGRLYESYPGVSMLQIQSYNTSDLLEEIHKLLANQRYFTWDYEKLKAILDFWQAGVVCESYYVNSAADMGDDLYGLYRKFFKLINKGNLLLTEEQKALLNSILKSVKDFCTL